MLARIMAFFGYCRNCSAFTCTGPKDSEWDNTIGKYGGWKKGVYTH